MIFYSKQITGIGLFHFTGKNGVISMLANSSENTSIRVISFSKVGVQRSATVLEKRLRQRCFPVNFAKFLITPVWNNSSDSYISGNRTFKPKLIEIKKSAAKKIVIYLALKKLNKTIGKFSCLKKLNKTL